MLQQAIGAIKSENCSVAIVTKDGALLTDSGSSVRPLFRLYTTHKSELRGAFAADRIIGKAAASLLADAGVAEAYGFLMSRGGLEMLERFGIDASYGELVERIDNRDGSDMCPMEKTVLDIDDPAACAAAIATFIENTPYPFNN